MAVRVIFSSLGHEDNMSRVRIAQDLEMLCLNKSLPISPACDRSAQGISLSTPILMTSFAVVGNVLALIVLYSSRREAHARRTVFFVMLAGLAWTDLIGQFAVSPIAIMTYANNLRWLGGAPLCRYHGLMMVSFGLVTPLIVCCMSVERLLAIKFSYYYAKHVTRRKAQITFLASWCVTALFTVMPFVGFGSYELQFPGTWCFLNFHRESQVDTVYAAMFSSFNIVAIAIMILCNFIVAATLFRMRRKRQLHSSPSIDRRLSASGGVSSTSGTVIRARRHSDMEAQMIWFLCLITVAFSVCWLPLNVHILCMQFTGTTNRVLDLKFIRMASCNQILDPWLYVIFRKNSVLRIVRRLKACLSVVQQVPKQEPTKPPNMRYVISNKSYTYEPSSLGKTVMGLHCCVNTPNVIKKIAPGGCQESTRNDCSECNSNSVAQLMSGCSYCDRECRNHSDSNPLLEVCPDLSPYSSETEPLHHHISENTSTFNNRCPSRHNKCESSCLQYKPHGASEPLLDRASVKPKKVKNKFMKSLDISVSSESYGGYYSLDSKHKPSIIQLNNSKPKKITSAELKQKSPFLGSSKNSANSPSLANYSHAIQLQHLFFLNSNNLLLLPAVTSPTGMTSSWHEEQDNPTTEHRRGNQTSSHTNIPLLLENIPELPTFKRNSHVIVNSRNQNDGFSDTVSSNLLHNSNNEKISVSMSVIDSPFLDSSNDILLSSPVSLCGSDLTNRCQKGGHHKTRSYSGAISNVYEEDFHLKGLFLPLKNKSYFISKCLSPSKANNKMNKSSVVIAGDKSDSSNSQHQSIDHSDHIKCFKSKKTPSFLGKNGQIAYLEAIRSQTSICEHGIIEQSGGSCP